MSRIKQICEMLMKLKFAVIFRVGIGPDLEQRFRVAQANALIED